MRRARSCMSRGSEFCGYSWQALVSSVMFCGCPLNWTNPSSQIRPSGCPKPTASSRWLALNNTPTELNFRKRGYTPLWCSHPQSSFVDQSSSSPKQRQQRQLWRLIQTQLFLAWTIHIYHMTYYARRNYYILNSQKFRTGNVTGDYYLKSRKLIPQEFPAGNGEASV